VRGDPEVLPEVSVVIPARDAAATIGEQLCALAAQTFDGAWEVIVVDDASTDGTAQVAATWADRLPSIRVLTSVEARGVSSARNIGTKAARADLVAYCDADDVVSTRWLAGLAFALNKNSLATGPIDLSRLNPPGLYAWPRVSEWQELPRWMGYLNTVMGANMAVRRKTFDLVGGFDETLANGEDNDFAFNVQLAGGTVGFAPDAVVHYRMRRGWSYFRRHFDYGSGQVELYRRFRRRGMPSRRLRGLVWLAGAGLTAPLVLIPRFRYWWMAGAGSALGRLAGSVYHRVLYP